MILHQVEGAMARHRVSPTQFGRDSCGDGRLVPDLRAGRQPKAAVAARILAYITALDRGEVAVSPGRGRRRPPVRAPKMTDIGDLPAVSARYEDRARRSAVAANTAFIAALAQVRPVGDAQVAPEPRFARLPPPTLIGAANS